MAVGDIISGVAAGVDNILNTVKLGYNLFTNQRDFDYQKALQQLMFQREDTAVQRRMADLEAAGLNPNLAAGSAANAGSVVARSNTNDLNPGSMLDTVMALQQIKNSKEQGEILKQQKQKEERENDIATMVALHSLGFDIVPDYLGKGKFSFKWPSHWENGSMVMNFGPINENKLFNQIDYQNNYLKNSADYMQKQNEWFVTNQIKDIVFDSVGAATNILKPNLKSYLK